MRKYANYEVLCGFVRDLWNYAKICDFVRKWPNCAILCGNGQIVRNRTDRTKSMPLAIIEVSLEVAAIGPAVDGDDVGDWVTVLAKWASALSKNFVTSLITADMVVASHEEKSKLFRYSHMIYSRCSCHCL